MMGKKGRDRFVQQQSIGDIIIFNVMSDFFQIQGILNNSLSKNLYLFLMRTGYSQVCALRICGCIVTGVDLSVFQTVAIRTWRSSLWRKLEISNNIFKITLVISILYIYTLFFQHNLLGCFREGAARLKLIRDLDSLVNYAFSDHPCNNQPLITLS